MADKTQKDEGTPVDTRPSKATPLEAGDPVEVDTIFGKPEKTAGPNSTFAERAKAREKSEKAVTSRSAENKSVKSSDSK